MKAVTTISILFLLTYSCLTGIAMVPRDNDTREFVKPIQYKEAQNLKASVIIPCYYKHASQLFSLIKMFHSQSVLPDEIVISISECHKVEPAIIKSLEDEPWRIPVKIIKSEKVQYAGENRNIACAQASGDILILQDADDIPHPQRVEIIKYFFEHYAVDHLMHQFTLTKDPAIEINFKTEQDMRAIPMEWGRNFMEVWRRALFANGHVAISKQVFEVIKWTNAKRRQDSFFNKQVYARFKHCLLVKMSLLWYRMFLSSLQI